MGSPCVRGKPPEKHPMDTSNEEAEWRENSCEGKDQRVVRYGSPVEAPNETSG